MYKTKAGSTRKILILLGFVIKVPITFSSKRRKHNKPEREFNRLYFWKGVVGNITEYATSKIHSHKLPFLVPVYLSLFGLINIQRHEKGRHPSKEELAEMKGRFSPEARRDVERVDSHHFQTTNFIVNDSGWHVIDYGNHLNGRGMSFSCFFVDHSEELKKLFCNSRT